MLCQSFIYISPGEEKHILVERSNLGEVGEDLDVDFMFKYEGLLDIFCTALAADPCRVSQSCMWDRATC